MTRLVRVSQYGCGSSRTHRVSCADEDLVVIISRRGLFRGILTILCLLVVSTNCGLEGPRNAPSPALPEGTVPIPSGSHPIPEEIPAQVIDCRNSIDRRIDLPDGYQSILGVAALPTSAASRRALQTTATSPTGPQLRLSAKSGLIARSGDIFELIVPEEGRGDLLLAWAGAQPTRQLRVDCSSATNRNGWLVFAGHYWVSRVGCYPLVVRAGAEQKRVTIGVGAPCPGQSPPEEPTDR